jgi:hypothetical protein
MFICIDFAKVSVIFGGKNGPEGLAFTLVKAWVVKQGTIDHTHILAYTLSENVQQVTRF